MIHVARRLFENLAADRHQPPLDRLDALVDPERFAWAILPYAARTFSFCIALLPPRTARALVVAYLYCRMLDTCEDLPAEPAAKEGALRSFLDRFRGVDALPTAPPALVGATPRDVRDQVYLLLLRRAERVDRLFLSLPTAQRPLILRLVERMGRGMVWAVQTFAAQGGALISDEQLSRYCFEVLGNPMLFAEEMQRLECGEPPEVTPERTALAAQVGEAIQLANVARDLEKDCAAGVFYLAELRQASAPERPAAIALARRRLLERALRKGRAFAPYMGGIPSPPRSLARGAGLLMELFTLAFWQRIAEQAGLDLFARAERVTRSRSIVLVVRAVLSRRGFEEVLAGLDRRFAAGAKRLGSRLGSAPRA